LFDLLARRRRQSAAMPAMVQHSESSACNAGCRTFTDTVGSAECASAKAFEWISNEPPELLRGGAADRIHGGSGAWRSGTRTQAAGSRRIVRPIFAGGRQRRSFRIGTNGAQRQQHGLLPGAAERADAPP